MKRWWAQGKQRKSLREKLSPGQVERQWSLLVQVIPTSFSSELNSLFFSHTVSLLQEFPFLFADESSKRVEPKVSTQEQHEKDWAHSCMKIGRLPALETTTDTMRTSGTITDATSGGEK